MEDRVKEYERLFNHSSKSIHYTIVNVQNNYARCHILRAQFYEILEDEVSAISYAQRASDVL